MYYLDAILLHDVKLLNFNPTILFIEDITNVISIITINFINTSNSIH